MKKVLLLTIMLATAFSLFAKEKKIKFNSASLNSTSKCARLAKKAFNDGFSVLKPEANLTIWKKDSENFIKIRNFKKMFSARDAFNFL